MKTFVIGDIHGAAIALEQVLIKSNFNKKKDQLIVLGDIVDGWPDVVKTVEILSEIENLICVQGNHDYWLKDYFRNNKAPQLWLRQGGLATITDYIKCSKHILYKHEVFFENQIPFYVDKNNRLFVHGGFNPESNIYGQDESYLMWDRELWTNARKRQLLSEIQEIPVLDYEKYPEIFIGHTAVRENKPQKACNVWNLDTGAGWDGVLSMMDINSKEYWTSDNVLELYQDVKFTRYG